jgi:omega-amidase
MASDTINISIIQPDIVWEDKAANLKQYEQYISGITERRHVVVLPEMFSTGFSMSPERLAEPMTGASVVWMKEMARTYRCILTGSLIIEEDGKYYNRLLWVQPDGNIGQYDKRHLFAYAGEDKHYTRGEKRLIVQVNGWRICLLVCYDLRFPIWARNKKEEYDVLLYVANWPQKRSLAWRTLLQARAIENMSYVVGVNRVGKDGKDIIYNGESAVYSPLGEVLWQQAQYAVCHTITLDKKSLSQSRTEYPFLKDADDFIIM